MKQAPHQLKTVLRPYQRKAIEMDVTKRILRILYPNDIAEIYQNIIYRKYKNPLYFDLLGTKTKADSTSNKTAVTSTKADSAYNNKTGTSTKPVYILIQ